MFRRTFRDRHPSTFNPDRLAVARGRDAVGAAAVFLGVFAVLYAVVRTNRSQAFDASVTLKLQRNRNRAVDRLMHIVSWPGFPPQSRLIPPGLSAMLWLLGFRLEALFQLLAWGTGGISFLVKRSMRRPRPVATAAETTIRVVAANIGGSSFPSGHVLNYIGVYGFLAYLAETWIRPPWLRRLVLAPLLALISLVGPSRIYLGHHWLTDVSASYLLGTTYLLALTNVYRRVRIWLSKSA
jgi:undecaprenyl-diphosphatase